LTPAAALTVGAHRVLIPTGGTDEDAYLRALEVADDLPALAPDLPANANTQQPHGRVAT